VTKCVNFNLSLKTHFRLSSPTLLWLGTETVHCQTYLIFATVHVCNKHLYVQWLKRVIEKAKKSPQQTNEIVTSLKWFLVEYF